MPELPERHEPPLTILYRDAHLIAIDKPPGLLVHRSNIDRHETRFAIQILRDQIGQRVYPAHRLDKGTSGVLLFGLSTEVCQQLGHLFETRQMDKRYLAVVRGHPPEAGLIDHALTRTRDDHEAPAAPAARPASTDNATAAQPAQTRYRRLATTEQPWALDRWPTSRYALLELDPITGRRHQLRRHLKHIAHPIIGDATYGKGAHNRMFQQQLDCHRLLLACTELAFTHPVSGAPLTLRAPLSGDFAALLHRLGWPDPTAGG